MTRNISCTHEVGVSWNSTYHSGGIKGKNPPYLLNSNFHGKNHIQPGLNPSKYDGWNPVPWYEQRGFNITMMHLAPENISSLGRGLVRTSGTVVRPEEVGIVLVVLMLWAAAITLFINRWGKIRLMEPYQPHFEAGAPSPPPTVLSGGGGTARPSICHISSIDRRPSVMLVQCIDESQLNTRRKSSQAQQYSSNLSVHRLETQGSGITSVPRIRQPPIRNLHLGYSAAPERRASFVSIFQHKNTAFNHFHQNSIGGTINNRRKSEVNNFFRRSSNDPVCPIPPPKKVLNSRRTSLQIPNLGVTSFGIQKSPFHSLLSLEDHEIPRTHSLLENSTKIKTSRDRRSIPNSVLPGGENAISIVIEDNENGSNKKSDSMSEFVAVPRFLYTTPTPDTERNSPDFNKLAAGKGSKPIRRKVGVLDGKKSKQLNQVVIQIPESDAESSPTSDKTFADEIPFDIVEQTPKQSYCTTQSKMESDV